MTEKLFTWPLSKNETNRAEESQKMARGLKLHIKEEKGLLNLCSKNKGADQLRYYHIADVRLCLCTCKKQVFS